MPELIPDYFFFLVLTGRLESPH